VNLNTPLDHRQAEKGFSFLPSCPSLSLCVHILVQHVGYCVELQKKDFKMKIFVTICVLMIVQNTVGYPQLKKKSREGRADELLQGCSPQQILNLDHENAACYKKVCFNFRGGK